MTVEHGEQLDRLCLLARERGAAVSERLWGETLHVKVAVRQRVMLLVWDERGRVVSESRAEEIGEDAGLYDPVLTPWRCRESERALLIREGYRGQVCEHEWSVWHADGRGASLWNWTCLRCGVQVTRQTARRGLAEQTSYDGWGLRPHILRAWTRRGPTPGSLKPQAHHLKGKTSL